ncbi:MAG: aspartate/glutamate racemase family protein, partial [Anaerolineales bacterium]
VLATPTTFDGDLYASVVERFGKGVTILPATCPGLVVEIESGRAQGEEAHSILAKALEPMLDKGVDTLVLGCTHFPFAFDAIRKIVGDKVRLIDPAPAIARRVESLLEASGQRNPRAGGGETRYLTSGDAKQMRMRVKELLGTDVKVGKFSWRAAEVVCG